MKRRGEVHSRSASASRDAHCAIDEQAPEILELCEVSRYVLGVTTPDTREMGRYFAGLPFVVGLVWLALQLARVDITMDMPS